MGVAPKARAGTRSTDLGIDRWDSAAADRYNAELGALVARFASWAHPSEVSLDADAQAVYGAWSQPVEYRIAEGGDLDHEDGWSVKMRDSVIRVAALLHLADLPELNKPITGDAMARACRIGDYWIQHRLDEIDDVLGKARQLLAALRRLTGQPGDVVKKRDLGRKGPRHLRKEDEIVVPTMTLIKMGWVRLETVAPVGKPTPIERIRLCTGFVVNPKPDVRQSATARQSDTESSGTAQNTHVESTDVALSRVSRIKPLLKSSSPTNLPSHRITGGGRDSATYDPSTDPYSLMFDPPKDTA